MANDASKSASVAKRQEKDRLALLERLRESPIVETACKQVGISRATYYRWREENKQFARLCDEAELLGRERMNDLSESRLMKNINEGHFQSIKYWLEHNKPQYAKPPQLPQVRRDMGTSPQDDAIFAKTGIDPRTYRLHHGEDSEYDRRTAEIARRYEEELKEAIRNQIIRKTNPGPDTLS